MARLTINGKQIELEFDPGTPLLWVLREQAGLTGAKYGCGIAQCGACTVHIDGNPVRSCIYPADALQAGQEITTIEGLSAEGDHPVQQACLAAFNEVTQYESPTFGIDGCSAPNHATTIHAMARAMAFFASANPDGSVREQAAVRLRNAMMAFPELVAGEGRACTRLMRATNGRAALKTGAEGYFIAIIPEQQVGVALKIADGGTRAANCAIASILVKLGVLDPTHPEAQAFINEPIKNRRDIQTGWMRPAATLQ